MSEEKKEEIVGMKLDGRAISSDGKITRTDYFKIIKEPLDKYEGITLTPEEAESYRNYMHRLSNGTTARVPLICAPVCPFRHQCPLFKMGKAPYTFQCPIERDMLGLQIQRYVQEYDIDPNSPTLLSMVEELAELSIYSERINQVLARPENATFTLEQTVGVTPNGTVLTRTEISPYWELKERIAARKSKLVKLLVGDPQEKYKRDAALRQRTREDPSQSMADLRAKIERIQKDADEVSSELATDVTPAEK